MTLSARRDTAQARRGDVGIAPYEKTGKRVRITDVGDGVLPWSAAEQMPLGYDVPFRTVLILHRRGGAHIRPNSAKRCHSEPVTVSLA